MTSEPNIPRKDVAEPFGGDFAIVEPEFGSNKFSAADLEQLRTDILQSNLDSFQSAEVLTAFLSGRGYGVSTDEARQVASRIEHSSTVEIIQAELDRVARAA